MTACPLISGRWVDFANGGNINTIGNAPRMRAAGRVGGRFRESLGRDGVEKADLGGGVDDADEEKIETQEAGNGRQLLIGGPVQVRRRRANKARQGRETYEEINGCEGQAGSFRSNGCVMMRGWPIATVEDSSPPRA